jgi:protein gp37
MAKNSKIEWTTHTYNPWIGCTKVSDGCKNCYAETLDRNRFSKTMDGGTKQAPVRHWGAGAPRHRTNTRHEVLGWNKEAKEKPHRCERCHSRYTTEKRLEYKGRCPNWIQVGDKPDALEDCNGTITENHVPRVFSSSLADVFDAEAPLEWFEDLLQLIDDTPNLNWLLLTKRPENIIPRMDAAMNGNFEPERTFLHHMPHVWLGTSVENQAMADKRIPLLLGVQAKARFLSCEPLLGSVDLAEWMAPTLQACVAHHHRTGHDGGGFGEHYRCDGCDYSRDENRLIHWVICGGESGPGARPMHPDWAQALCDQCAFAGVPFLFKQWGEFAPDEHGETVMLASGKILTRNEFITTSSHTRSDLDTGAALSRVGKQAAGRHLDGQLHDEYPAL